MTPTDTLREAVFDILWPLQSWEGDEDVCRAAVAAALSAIEAAGWRIVPVDAIPIIKAVAHIGVDFGYGPYQVEEKFIKSSREILDALSAAPRLDATVRGEEG